MEKGDQLERECKGPDWEGLVKPFEIQIFL
jgi:hypothetical protein